MNHSKILRILLPVLLFVAILLFFGLCYPHHLHFQEQYQLFLFDGGYMADILAVPGGLADLVGRFLTQFFLLSWVGASIMGLLLTGIFLLVLRRVQSGWFRAFCLLPVLALWIFFCEENALLGAIVALFMALLSDWGISSVADRKIRLVVRWISVPLLYWALGPVAVVTCLLGLVTLIRSHNKQEILSAFGCVLFLLAMPLLAQHFVALPLERLYLAPHYHRYPSVVPTALWLAAASAVLVPFLPATSSNRWMSLVVWGIVVCASGWTVKSFYNASSEVVMSYDFMTRFQQWNRIVETANKKKPNNALSCTALNLALGMKGQLAERMFEYNQNGVAGLLPDFQRDAVSTLLTSEVYYQLGLINTAQRLVFEAQESILDFQKSGRCYRRLAETNLLSGNYEVALKYLDALSKTIFYRDWALERIALLHDEEAIRKHKEYGHLRAIMPKKDCFFSDRAIPKLLGQQMLANGTNRLAYEYLQCSYLLDKNLEAFASCLGMASTIKYMQMPKMFQQAYTIWWSQNRPAHERMPEFISQKTMQGMNQFVGSAQNMGSNAEKLKARYGNTYWYYYFVH